MPSGLPLTLFDVILEEEEKVARFRFEAPDIDANGPAVTFAAVVDDLQYLCDRVLLPGLIRSGWREGQVIVSFSSAQIPFGEVAPTVTQFFQPFRIGDGTCIWEDF